MPSEIPVTKTTNGEHGIAFEEADIRTACKKAGCSKELMEDCIAEMKLGNHECISCYVQLIAYTKPVPNYEYLEIARPKDLQVQEYPK